MSRFSKTERMLIALVLVTVTGCRPPGDVTDTAGSHPRGAPPTELLRNITYEGLATQTHPVTLLDGRWEGRPFEEGGSSRPSVSLVTDFILTGDLDGDAKPEAAVLLAENSGGTGEYISVAIVAHRGDSVRNIATALLGDRVKICRGEIRNQCVLLDVLQAGPGDAMCCPGELATRGWELQSGTLKEIDTGAPKGRLALATALGEGEWVLTHWDHGSPAPAQPEVTLSYGDGHLQGRSGCNRYSMQATDGAGAGEISSGVPTTTRMMCSDSAMAVERRFLDILAHVSKVGFLNGRCALMYEREGSVGAMLFERRPTPGTRR